MTQPFFPVARPSVTELEHKLVMRAVQSGWISSLGEFIDRFLLGILDFPPSDFLLDPAHTYRSRIVDIMEGQTAGDGDKGLEALFDRKHTKRKFEPHGGG